MWLELIVREAAIYIAVLFFPVALAASIWPALQMWVRRLGMLLLMFVLLRPVVVIVLALAGSVTSEGLSFGQGGIPHSVGTILAGVVIFALAAFTPWALMFLLGTEVGVMHSRGGGSGNGRASMRRAWRGRRGRADRRVADERAAAARERRRARGRDRRWGWHGRGRCRRRGRAAAREPRWLAVRRAAADSGGSIAAAAGWTGVAAGAVGARQPPARSARGGANSGRLRAHGRRPRRRAPGRPWASTARRHTARAGREAAPPAEGSPPAARLDVRATASTCRPRPGADDASPSAPAPAGAWPPPPARSTPPASADVTDDGHWGENGPPHSGDGGHDGRGGRMSDELRYRFGPRPHGGFMLGFRLPQLAGFVLAGRPRDRRDVARRDRRDRAGRARRRARRADPDRSGARAHGRGVGAALRPVRDRQGSPAATASAAPTR